LNNGDYNHGSGAVSRAQFQVGVEGLTLEVEGWANFTGGFWQIWSVGLLHDRPDPLPTELSGGSIHLGFEGHSPRLARPGWACATTTPTTGEWDFRSINRRWRRFVLQIRPDGYYECLVEGGLLATARMPSEARGRPLSIVLRGHSVGTEIYHGRVVVTRGLRY